MKTEHMTTRELKNDSFACPYCGQPAFYIIKTLKIGEMIAASNVIFNDESHPKSGDPITCQYCKRPICGRFI